MKTFELSGPKGHIGIYENMDAEITVADIDYAVNKGVELGCTVVEIRNCPASLGNDYIYFHRLDSIPTPDNDYYIIL